MFLVQILLPIRLAFSILAVSVPSVGVTVDPGAARHPVSPFIYGVNFGDSAQAAALRWPLRRWGGNSTTRYSWQDDIANHASDYLFYNIENDNPNPGALPDGSASDRFIDETRATGGAVLLTVPTIGWTPIDRVRRWGFSIAKYGAQQENECTINPFLGCNADAGNGNHADGTPVTGNDPHDTSRVVDASFATGWMQHIAGRVGTASAGGVRLFALDNEPELWNSTHRDVHPLPLTYDELWSRTLSYASAIKTQDPAAIVFGPEPWGWCAYFFSAADDSGCGPGLDRTGHGGVDILPWYMQQVQAHLDATGVRLVDVVDVHYYPQAPGVTLSSDESAGTSALRLRTLKSLYDPAYVDESWIGQPVQLIPRLKTWIAANLPGAGLSISEYNWGNDAGASSALAQAEALAIFGREGVDYATRWVAPDPGSAVENSFRLYLDYDGAGSRVSGDSVQATSGDLNSIGSYAIAGTGNRLYLLFFNKTTSALGVTVAFPSPQHWRARLYEFDAGHSLGPAGSILPTAGSLNATLPSRSATLAVTLLDFDDVPSGSSFYPFVMKLADDGVSAGCGGSAFCPESTVTRAQMAVFLLRSKNGVEYAPPAATGTVFTDVPASSFAAAWIETLYADAISTGCGAGIYCPGDPVTRAQMAVFLLRTLDGAAYVPPPATGTMFSDVPANGFAAAWIEQLAVRGISAGCGGGRFCPASSVTRGQMAVFLVQTFGLV